MPNRRIARLNEQMKREISGILLREVQDPRVGMPTVTGVAVTPDLFFASVYVRPDPTLGDDPERAFLDGLAMAAPFIRRELGRTLKVRRVPELRFEEDRTLDQARRIEEILRGVRADDPSGAAAPGCHGGPPRGEGTGRGGEEDPAE